MEQYLKKKVFIEDIVIHPKYLDKNLNEHLKSILTKKYSTNYKNKGFIFNIEIKSILDNKITMSNQIILNVQFICDLYTPEIGHIFHNTIKKSLKYQWVKINSFIIHLQSDVIYDENEPVTVEIINIKSDNTLCFGRILPHLLEHL
jgi:DNA-directed RNA polymerase subunit E'/Rpb7